MTLFPAPKPARAPRLVAKQGQRLQRKSLLAKASKRKQATSYGGSDWQKFKRAIYARDGHTCVWCGKPSCLPLTVAHLRQKVQMGGRSKSTVNFPKNAATLGLLCHAMQEDGHIPVDEIEARLAERYGYDYLEPEA